MQILYELRQKNKTKKKKSLQQSELHFFSFHFIYFFWAGRRGGSWSSYGDGRDKAKQGSCNDSRSFSASAYSKLAFELQHAFSTLRLGSAEASPRLSLGEMTAAVQQHDGRDPAVKIR